MPNIARIVADILFCAPVKATNFHDAVARKKDKGGETETEAPSRYKSPCSPSVFAFFYKKKAT